MNTAISQDVYSLTYRQLQAELKTFGTDVMVKLNSSYQVLLAEYQRLTDLFVTNYKVEEVNEDLIEEEIKEEIKEESEEETKIESVINSDINDDYNSIDIKTAYKLDHFKYAKNYNQLSSVEKAKLLNALNYYLKAYGAKEYQLADYVVSVDYRHEANLWQIKYCSKDNFIVKWETMYDSELINSLVQTNNIEVFEPIEELTNIVSGLREEFSNVGVINLGKKIIVSYRSLTLTFLIRNNQLIYCAKTWDFGKSWVNHEISTIYQSHSQIDKLINQIRSDFWFETEVLSVS